MSTLAQRLDVLCEVNRRLATFTSLDDLLRFATLRARELFEAEGCALLLVDADSGEFRFPVSSQSATSQVSSERLQEIRFPITQGVAGWVLTHGEAVAVDDVQHDARFYRGVDQATGAQTRSVLCAPLRSGDGSIGVLEVINPGPRGEGDLPFLEALASNVAVAHEKAALHAALRAEVTGLRRLVRTGGVVLGALGGAVVGAAVVAHMARALPVSEVWSSPGVLLGLAVLSAGVALTIAMRRVPSAV